MKAIAQVGSDGIERPQPRRRGVAELTDRLANPFEPRAEGLTALLGSVRPSGHRPRGFDQCVAQPGELRKRVLDLLERRGIRVESVLDRGEQVGMHAHDIVNRRQDGGQAIHRSMRRLSVFVLPTDLRAKRFEEFGDASRLLADFRDPRAQPATIPGRRIGVVAAVSPTVSGGGVVRARQMIVAGDGFAMPSQRTSRLSNPIADT